MLINLRVESSSIELKSPQQAISLATLQSVYPSASGLAYQLKDGSKCSIQFDGKSFIAPKDGWADVDYYVIMGNHNAFTLKAYQTTCDQLEKTVNTIKQLMSSTSSNNHDDLILDVYSDDKSAKKFIQNGKPNVRERHGSFRNQYATLKSSNGDNRIDLWMPRKNSDELERQFSELSSILVGKNAIIESQRRQLQTERTVNEELEKSSEQARSELEEWKQRCQALERELNLIREMGTKQEFMGNKVKMLNAELENTKNSNNVKLEEMQKSLSTVKTDLTVLNQKHENLQSEHNRLIVEVNEKKAQLEELQRLTKRLEFELSEHQRQYAEQSKCSHDLEERLCRENIGLAEWAKKLELENKQQQLAIDQIKLESTQQINTLNTDFEEKISQIREEYEAKCQESKNLNNLTESLHKHLTQITLKYNELDKAYTELKINQNLYLKDRRTNSPMM